MPKMYVANCTAQVHDFQYTFPGQQRARKQTIEPGGQIAISGDPSLAQIESVVRHHSKYGMLAVSELARAGRKVVPLVFNTEKPVPKIIIERTIHENRLIMEGQGQRRREEAGVVVHKTLEEEARKQGPLQLNELEVSIEEIDAPDGKATDDHTQVNEITRITRNEEPAARAAAPAHKRRNRNRAKAK